VVQAKGSPIAQPPSDTGLSVIIVTYNSATVLSGLLDSLPAGLAGIRRFEIIVVDNESADSSVDIAHTHAVRPRVIRMGRNAGYAAAINAGAVNAHPDSDLLILNPDVRLLPSAARLLVDRLTDSSVGVAVPRVLAEDGTFRWSLRREPSIVTAWTDAILGGTFAARTGMGEKIGDPTIYDRSGLIEWATGAILAVAARARHVVGDWDESFFLYCEEVDYQRRIRDCGFSVAYVPQAQAVHIEGKHTENPDFSALLSANRIRYYRRYHGPLSTAVFRLSIIVGEGIRAVIRRSPGHRAAARAALESGWSPAESQPQYPVRRGSPDVLPAPSKTDQPGSKVGIERR
jgi:N-acetylglucosaminyl-diphospho-decaprenol L-rhamnosyltransferase